jgi:hypothetical protein
MIRFQVKGPIPKSIYDDQVHHITCRNTFYGFHKHVRSHNIESSKTNLIAFTSVKHAVIYKDILSQVQERGSIIERCADDTYDSFPSFAQKNVTGSILPLNITTVDLSSILMLCILQYFDMYIVYDIKHDKKIDEHTLVCYEFTTAEPPHRSFMNLYLEKLLLK